LRWLVDENVPKQVANWLAARGDDVLDIAASPHRGASDQALWALAGREGRVVVTRDLGFLWPALTPCPAGVVILRVPQEWGAAEIGGMLLKTLSDLGVETLLGSVTVAEPGRTRQRRLADVPQR
jgi:predicted nuclease of predicted toxin-antitoxin system